MSMILYEEFKFDKFTPWGGAAYTYHRIAKEGKGSEFEQILEEMYPNGISRSDLNDLLWMEAKEVLGWLGIEEEKDEVSPTSSEDDGWSSWKEEDMER